MGYMRNIPITILKGTSPNVVGRAKLYDLLNQIATDKKLLSRGLELKSLYNSDYEAYRKRKDFQPGFMLGDFSYRDKNSLVEYYPIMGFDIDKIKTEEERKNLFETLKNWEYTFLVLPSISGMGLRLLVCTDSVLDTHKEVYLAICEKLSTVTKIPLKATIRESLKGLGKTSDEVKQYLDENTHIDDVASDVSRFWYFSGVDKSEIYLNNKSKVWTTYEPVAESKDYQYTFTETDKVDYLVTQIESSHIDITAGVPEWFKVGLALYDALGDQAEDYFYRVSQFHPDYNRKNASREWQRVKSKYQPGRVTIATFYKWCEDYGLGIDWQELKKIHSDKFSNTALKTVNDFVESNEPDLGKFELLDSEAERCVLAGCLSNERLVEKVFDACPKFSHNCFFDLFNQKVFQAIQKLISEGLAVNLISIKSKLRFSNELSGEAKINKLLSDNFYPDDIETNAKIVYELFLKRQLISLSQKAVSDLTTVDVNVFEYLEEMESGFRNVGDFGASRTELDSGSIGQQLRDDYQKKLEYYEKHGKGALTGVPTGMQSEDEFTGGFQPSDLIVIAARPGMGKTAKVLRNAIGASKAGYPVGFFSLEMSAKQLGERAAAMMSEVELKKIKTASFSPTEFQAFDKALNDFSELPIYVDERASVTVEYIHRIASKWKRVNDVKLIIVDYLQLITHKDKHKSTNDKIEDITRALKIMAKDLNVPVIALSQLSRAVETRGGSKRPQLSDLRSSGAIEQDADIVQFIYRAEYYDLVEDGEGESLKGVAELIFDKHRNGETGSVYVAFDSSIVSFMDKKDYKGDSVFGTDEDFWNNPPGVHSIPNIAPSKMNDDEDIPF